MLRFDGPLYTANVRRVNRPVLAAVDDGDADTLVLDMSAVARTPLTVVDRFADLEAELGARGVRCWFAALPTSSLETARQLPRWHEMVADGRLFPTALAAVRAFRAERSATPAPTRGEASDVGPAG